MFGLFNLTNVLLRYESTETGATKGFIVQVNCDALCLQELCFFMIIDHLFDLSFLAFLLQPIVTIYYT